MSASGDKEHHHHALPIQRFHMLRLSYVTVAKQIVYVAFAM